MRHDVAAFLEELADRRFKVHLARTQPQAWRIYDIEALSFRRLRQQRHAAARQLRELEEEGIRTADAIFCVSEEEAMFARSLTAAPVFVLPPTTRRPSGCRGTTSGKA